MSCWIPSGRRGKPERVATRCALLLVCAWRDFERGVGRRLEKKRQRAAALQDGKRLPGRWGVRQVVECARPVALCSMGRGVRLASQEVFCLTPAPNQAPMKRLANPSVFR